MTELNWLASGCRRVTTGEPIQSAPLLALSLSAVMMVGCGKKDTPSPLRSMPSQSAKLVRYFDECYDPDAGLVAIKFRGPTYHSNLAVGCLVHPYRESAIYAIALLQRGGPRDVKRAEQILACIVDAQDRDVSGKTCGIWPWHLEEPLGEMPEVDHNWADFMGALVAQTLIEHSSELSPKLVSDLRYALRLAAEHIRRRDVGPSYTNIAVLGGCVCAASGEVLNDASLVEYGRKRLESVVTHAEKYGGFAEYNSPPYSQVVVGECERTLQLVSDPSTRRAARALWERTWRVIGQSFHSGTQQWAGPHSRAGSQRLKPSSVEFLNRRTDWNLSVHSSMTSGPWIPSRYSIVRAISAIEFLRKPEFARASRTLQREFVRTSNPERSRIGMTWKTDDACLGSVSFSCFFNQRKPLIGYWRTDDDSAIVFCCRCLSDGRDFASMGIRSSQESSRVDSRFEPLTGRGYEHTRLDRPQDNRFVLRNVRIRYQLRGKNVELKQLDSARYRLMADHRAIELTTRPGTFFNRPIRWEAGRSGDTVYVDAICWNGEPTEFDFAIRKTTDISARVELVKLHTTIRTLPRH